MGTTEKREEGQCKTQIVEEAIIDYGAINYI